MRSKSNPLTLARLLPDISPRRFLSEYWPGRFFVSRGALGRMMDIAGLPQLASVESVAACYAADVRVWPPPGERSVLRVRPAEALGLYRAGWTFYAVGIDEFVPALSSHLRVLEQELGLTRGSGRCSVFATRKGAGALPHFDCSFGFNLQLRGRKRWTVAENRSVVDPTVGYRIGDDPSEELRLCCRVPLPRTMPRGTRSYLLSPGDVAFNPRGMWHATSCRDDSLALDFDFLPRSFADIVLSTVRKRLSKHPAWRRKALTSPGGARDLRSVLRHLPAALGNLTSSEVIRDLAGAQPGGR